MLYRANQSRLWIVAIPIAQLCDVSSVEAVVP